MTFPKFGKLSLADLGKGFIMTFIMTFVAAIYEWISDGTLPTVPQLKSAALIGLGAGVSYIFKNLFSGVPATVEIDPTQTTVIHADTKKVLAFRSTPLPEEPYK